MDRSFINRILFMYTVILLALIFVSSLQAQTTVSEAPRPDIVEANHFYSETNTKKSYKISSLTTTNPLSVVIKAPSTAT